MSDKSNIGKGFLKDKLGEYQVDPPESVWTSISATLGGRSRRGLYVLLLATAASVALAITLGIHFFGPQQVESDQLGGLSPAESPQPSELSAQEEALQQAGGQSRGEALVQAEASPESAGEPPRHRAGLREKVLDQVALVVKNEEIAGNENVPGNKELLIREEKLADRVEEQIAYKEANKEAGTETGAEAETGALLEDPTLDTMALLLQKPEDDLPLDQIPELEPEARRNPRWMVGAVMSPLYSFRDAHGQALEGGMEHESGLVSYAGGVNVSYRRNSRLAFETGIHFSKMGVAIGAPGIQLFNRSYDFAPMLDNSSSPELIAIGNSVGNIVTKSGDVIVNGYKLNAEYGAEAISNSGVGDFAQTAEQGIEQHLDYLEVPFNLRYTVVDRAFELQLVGGVSTNFLVNNTVTMKTASGTTDIGYLTNIRNVNYSGNAGIGMIYHLHKKFSILLEPRFRYFLNSVNDSSLPTTRPYALGIYTGLSYTF